MSVSLSDKKARRATWLVLSALLGGLLLGVLSNRAGTIREPLITIASTVGGLWLDGLKMTVIPLIIALLVTGVVSGADQAKAGRIAARSVIWFVIVLTLSAAFGTLLMPVLLEAFPLPASSAEALRAGLASVDSTATAASVPSVQDWLRSLIPTNVFAAAAEDKVLALVVFTSIFAFAVTQIDKWGRQSIAVFFKAIQDAMLVVVGWVLWLAPIGVFGLAFAVGAGAGGAAFGAVLHYVVLVSLVGVLVTLAAYVVAVGFAKWKLSDFARAMIPPQAVAISTQSSLASLPAMLEASTSLRVPARNADVSLPLAVALFRATGPAMNVSVAIYVAYMMGVELHAGNLIAGFAVAAVASYWAVSLPGALSFVTSIAPIALAMGVPIEPLALLIAVEVLPDITRTLGNVTWDVAVTGAASGGERAEN
ncbi:dicarboxylate/amino acid:cation symporter [Sphingomonas sp. RB56-2]|uniref:Dicarboxylate/amino acid:cation symporter n=1 Tax=Sphingomonas brevis TaxID=2908206 RepID=A0ABT0S8W0_9SPHN|nr:cation:dicarboxylase symporter family transporter [Sphingomonas brevis]MCL6740823.1 dicarboxylate/amino acid:cation symporter [Sphingomonas brevis]